MFVQKICTFTVDEIDYWRVKCRNVEFWKVESRKVKRRKVEGRMSLLGRSNVGRYNIKGQM